MIENSKVNTIIIIHKKQENGYLVHCHSRHGGLRLICCQLKSRIANNDKWVTRFTARSSVQIENQQPKPDWFA
jgi:hypothetical protein